MGDAMTRAIALCRACGQLLPFHVLGFALGLAAHQLPLELEIAQGTVGSSRGSGFTTRI